MANIQIPETLNLVLEDAAHRAGRTKDDLAEEILSAHLEDQSFSFSDAQLTRLKEGIAQLDRGEKVSSEQVDLKFKAFFKRQAARCES